MTSAVVYVIVAGLVTALSDAQCNMSEWSDWGSCQCARTATGHSHDAKRQMTRFDNGRFAQDRLMKLKKQQASRAVQEHPESRTDGPVKCTNGSAGIFPCHNVDQLSFINMADLGYDNSVTSDSSPRLNDIWGWYDEYTGDEYVIVGLTGGSSFVRVTDPEHPQVLGFLYTVDIPSLWRDMKVVNDHVYIVADDYQSHHGMQIFDLTQLRHLDADPTRVFKTTAHWTDFGNAHNVVSNPETNTIFVVGSYERGLYPNTCAGGLYMLDVSDPIRPTFLGCFGDDGYTHDAQCMVYQGPDKRYESHEICFCFNEDTFTIVDVTDKTDVHVVSRMAYDGAKYTHQGWCNKDLTLVLMDDELDEYNARSTPGVPTKTRTYIWDIRNLQLPVLKNIYYSSQDAVDHNQYVVGDYTYQSNYKAGFRLLKILAEAYDLREVAYFDVHPLGTSATFGGSWSNYPYLKSGAVAVTSMEYGLFLLKPDWTKIAECHQDYGLKMKTRTNQAGGEDPSAHPDMTCAGLEQLALC